MIKTNLTNSQSLIQVIHWCVPISYAFTWTQQLPKLLLVSDLKFPRIPHVWLTSHFGPMTIPDCPVESLNDHSDSLNSQQVWIYDQFNIVDLDSTCPVLSTIRSFQVTE